MAGRVKNSAAGNRKLASSDQVSTWFVGGQNWENGRHVRLNNEVSLQVKQAVCGDPSASNHFSRPS